MEIWQPTPRVQSLVPKRGLYSSQALTTRPLGRRRVLAKIFQVQLVSECGSHACSCSCRCCGTMSLKCCHELAYCSSPTFYMNMGTWRKDDDRGEPNNL